jgi:exocyst complex component 2
VDKLQIATKVLKRFSFVFQLPSSIEADITYGDYEKIIVDYKKAKQMILQSMHIPAITKINDDITKVMKDFRVLLYKQLEGVDSPLEESEHIIGVICEM